MPLFLAYLLVAFLKCKARYNEKLNELWEMHIEMSLPCVLFNISTHL
jgi:hypothetical protein